VKQITVAGCSSVTCWCMAPLVCSRYPHQCKKYSVSAVSVGKWWPYWTTGGMRWRSWFSHCATSRKVAGL